MRRSPEVYCTRVVYDVQGNPTAVVDPRDNTIQVQVFDMVGRVLFRDAADEGYTPTTGAGEARVLPDAAGAPVRVWRSGDTSGLANENITQQAFDVLRRPTVQTFTQGTASPPVVELRRTGERGGAPERPLAPADQGSGPGAQPPQSATRECPPRQARPIAPRDPRPPRGAT